LTQIIHLDTNSQLSPDFIPPFPRYSRDWLTALEISPGSFATSKMQHLQLVAVGDTGVGKTSLFVTYATNTFPGDYVQTVFDNYSVNLTVDDQAVNLQPWDTAGARDYQMMRPLSYPQTDIFLICFSLVSPTSLESVEKVWIPELKEHCPDVPYVLVGLKSDLRDQFADHAEEYQSQGLEPISTAKGEEFAKAINAQGYVECSAKIASNVKEVFETAARVTLPQAAARATAQSAIRAAAQAAARAEAESDSD
jgi:Ras-related C3 botulinum toxin substrate 1